MKLQSKTAIVTGASHGTARAASPAAWQPVTLLKITVWPKLFSAARARPRAKRSLPPPAAYGQTIVTGRSGKCATVRSRPRRRTTKPTKQRTTVYRSQSLWLSFDGMPVFSFTRPHQRVLQEEAENTKIGISYLDGFVSKDGK